MEYLYSVTCTYDGEAQPRWVGRFSDCLSAVETYQNLVAKCTLRFFIKVDQLLQNECYNENYE